jgi:2-polyprenyl-3-methyl-5-hydroxy-6-metoxy-1,4-benzoquinol methylase
MDKVELDAIAQHYNISSEFEYVNTKIASRIICPYCDERHVLEVGCASGEMTGDLVEVAASLTVLEASSLFSSAIRSRFGSKIRVVDGFIEDIQETTRYDVIVIAGVLHHLDDPVAFLNNARRFLNENGVVLATVPNMTSLHRRLGVKAGMIREVSDTTERNLRYQQPGRFVKASLEDLFLECGYNILESYAYMLKPFSSEQMWKLELSWPIINALCEIGKEYQDLASQLFVRAGASACASEFGSKGIA